MKRFFCFSLLVSLALAGLTGCATDPTTSDTTSPYDRGIERGLEDGRFGRSRDPGRYAGTYPAKRSAAFTSGYENGYNRGIRPEAISKYGQPLTAEVHNSKVIIKEGNATVATCQAASSSIEKTRFINEQQQLVVKSRGNHGPATVQLFQSDVGVELERVMAYEINEGAPSWAAGMED